MDDYKRMGLLIKQAREEKGWTQQELADAMDVDVETVSKQEGGDDSLSVEMMVEYCLLLNISCDIAIYEKDVETALRMEKICRGLLELSQEQFDRLVNSASYMRGRRKD
ncbi:MAG: helix-turn-helix transcriptional regulator [Eubacterium sp.]|jgi:transcriptional regulator with XRE-family HTH domain|nr:helix-turn-helix transcriptional regulator [Eubacterium sp.]NBI86560.1 XRE family transcriptional regulator [Lachnospiraceae bacterium]